MWLLDYLLRVMVGWLIPFRVHTEQEMQAGIAEYMSFWAARDEL